MSITVSPVPADTAEQLIGWFDRDLAATMRAAVLLSDTHVRTPAEVQSFVDTVYRAAEQLRRGVATSPQRWRGVGPGAERQRGALASKVG